MDNKSVERLLDAAVAIRQGPDDADVAFIARNLILATLPHSNPGDVPEWTRTNGNLKLTIRPIYRKDKGGHLYPYGSVPRLLLFWLCGEAIRKSSRRIVLGKSLNDFMRQIGLEPGSGGGKYGDAKRLQNQMERLFRATISFETVGGPAWIDMAVAPKGMQWWNPARPQEDALWEGWVELGEDFYNAIIAVPVPVDLRALKALKRSPLALDLYAWLTYTSFSVSRRKHARTVPWSGLHGQFGSSYTQVNDFRAKVRLALKKIQLVYPSLRVEMTAESLTVLPTSRTAIESRA